MVNSRKEKKEPHSSVCTGIFTVKVQILFINWSNDSDFISLSIILGLVSDLILYSSDSFFDLSVFSDQFAFAPYVYDFQL